MLILKRKWNFAFINGGEFFLLVKRPLASQDGICCVEFAFDQCICVIGLRVIFDNPVCLKFPKDVGSTN
jgi:hypothetical protein